MPQLTGCTKIVVSQAVALSLVSVRETLVAYWRFSLSCLCWYFLTVKFGVILLTAHLNGCVNSKPRINLQ